MGDTLIINAIYQNSESRRHMASGSPIYHHDANQTIKTFLIKNVND